MSEKRYYWLKLKRDFFKRHDIQIIEDIQPNGKEYVLFYLKLLVESIDHDGELRFSDTIPYNANMLATITRTNPDIVRSALKVLSEFGMVEILDDQTIYMSAVENLIGSAADNDHAKRQQRYRDRKKQLALEQKETSVTKSDAPVTERDKKSDESKSKSIEKDIENNNNAVRRKEIIEYLNQKTGKSFKPNSQANIKLVEARLNEGWTVEDFKKVIDNKVAEWKDTEQDQYLRPETLFAPSHFESYLNQRKVKAKKKGNTLSQEMSHDYDMDDLRRRAKE